MDYFTNLGLMAHMICAYRCAVVSGSRRSPIACHDITCIDAELLSMVPSRNMLQWSLNQNTNLFFQENASEIVVCAKKNRTFCSGINVLSSTNNHKVYIQVKKISIICMSHVSYTVLPQSSPGVKLVKCLWVSRATDSQQRANISAYRRAGASPASRPHELTRPRRK